eukprot:5384824-Amphidinium_carterae.1
MVKIAFRLPNAGPTDWSRKELPMDHKDLRWPKAQTFNVGDWVEIFSNSNQMWCPGRVTYAAPGQVRVAFHVPGGDVNDWVEKDLPAGSQEIRHVGAGGAEVRKL